MREIFTGQHQPDPIYVTVSTDEEAARYGLQFRGRIMTGYYLEPLDGSPSGTTEGR